MPNNISTQSSIRKFVVQLLQKDPDPEKAVWLVIWGRKDKDIDGKDIYMPDDREKHTLEELRGELASLSKKEKLVKELIKEIEKQM
jgi:hypothetical protein